MAIRLNEALRASVGSTDAPNRVLDDSVSSDRRAEVAKKRVVGLHYSSGNPIVRGFPGAVKMVVLRGDS